MTLDSGYDFSNDPNLNCLNHQHPKGPACEKCHHDAFPNKTIQQELGDENLKACCSMGHGYIFKDHCVWKVRVK